MAGLFFPIAEYIRFLCMENLAHFGKEVSQNQGTIENL
jgi:hypothetical protein